MSVLAALWASAAVAAVVLLVPAWRAQRARDAWLAA
jgi:hypothetical protein